jgi:mono/diheme cytochrome c family protein
VRRPFTAEPIVRTLCFHGAAVAATLLIAAGTGAAEPDESARLTRGWTALRAMDCARCHGRDLDGWAAPSLIAAVRDGSRERFDRYVLDGDIGRGMPGYRSQPVVVAELDAIYAYLLARARGELGPGDPSRGR